MSRIAARICLAAFAFLLLLACPPAAQQGTSGPWFEADRLNSGLDEPPDWLDRSTPQGTLESFVTAMSRGVPQAAAHLLDLRDVAPEDQPGEGATLAGQLDTVLSRKVVIDWKSLSDRPDGILPEVANEPEPQPKRSILLWSIELDGRSVPIRLNRIKPGEDDPVWVFSRQTVANIPRLAELHGPSRFERLLPAELRERAIFRLYWWELIALPFVAGLGILLGWVVRRIVTKAANANRYRFLSPIIRSVRVPVVLLTVSGFVWAASTLIFVFSGPIDVVLDPLVATGFVAAAIILLVNTVDEIMSAIIDLENEDLTSVGPGYDERRSMATRVAAFRRVALVVVFLIGVGIVLSSAGLFRTVGVSLLASAGVLTLIFGFAARNVLANIMASLQISANQSARIGDKIMFRGYLCTVERVNFTFVQLRAWTGERLVVPVTTFTEEVFENWMLQSTDTTRTVILKLATEADVDEMREAFFRILDAGYDAKWQLGDREEASVKVSDHDVFGKSVMFQVPTSDPNAAWEIGCDVREKLIAEGIRIQEKQERRVFPEVPHADPV